MSPKPECWRCGGSDVLVRFAGHLPVYHRSDECDCPPGKDPCGEVPDGRLCCRSCGNVWRDGDVSEFRLES